MMGVAPDFLLRSRLHLDPQLRPAHRSLDELHAHRLSSAAMCCARSSGRVMLSSAPAAAAAEESPRPRLEAGRDRGGILRSGAVGAYVQQPGASRRRGSGGPRFSGDASAACRAARGGGGSLEDRVLAGTAGCTSQR